jgi:hypothetical protein
MGITECKKLIVTSVGWILRIHTVHVDTLNENFETTDLINMLHIRYNESGLLRSEKKLGLYFL